MLKTNGFGIGWEMQGQFNKFSNMKWIFYEYRDNKKNCDIKEVWNAMSCFFFNDALVDSLKSMNWK